MTGAIFDGVNGDRHVVEWVRRGRIHHERPEPVGFGTGQRVTAGSYGGPGHATRRAEMASDVINDITDQNFADEIEGGDGLYMVDFWAEWCGPCKQIGPALEELSEEYGEKIKIAKINVDENPNSPSKLGVRGIPALFIFKDGEMISSKIGAAPKTDLKNWIDEST